MTRTYTITRHELSDFIEEAIKLTPELAEEDAEVLRRVVATTKAVRVGNYSSPPYCPVTQAGWYYPRNQYKEQVGSARSVFACNFDRVVDQSKYNGAQVLEVEDAG